MITLWHNSRCSKSREALNILEIHGRKYEVFEYLKNEITKDSLLEVITQLGIKDVRDMLRTKETLYKELDIANEIKSQDEILDLVLANPKLIERPIIINEGVAVIARPMENMTNLLGINYNGK